MTRYESGRRKEWDAVKRLRARGFEAQRSAGSHGLWDVVAVKPHQGVKLLQIKYTAATYFPHDANTERFAVLALQQDVPVDCEVWVYRRGVAEPEIWVPVFEQGGHTWERYRNV
jgi:Archaeal holliday junction resolvase (hjc)